MSSDLTRASDDASIVVPTHHHLAAVHSATASLLRPADHFGHSVEELLDLARTRHNGGDHVVSAATLDEALRPCRNAVRVIVRDPASRIKQLILGANIRTNNGGIWQAQAMGGDAIANSYENHSGAITYAATTVTPTSSPSWTVNAFTGHMVVAMLTASATSQLVFGNIVSNSATVLTIDGWWTLATGAAASTPAANDSFAILPGQAPAWWVAVSTDSAAVDQGNTTLTSEQSTGFSVNPRWRGTYTLTTTPSTTGNATQQSAVHKIDAGVQTYTGGGVTLAKMGLFATANGGNLLFVKLLASTAVLATNDTIDCSWSLTEA